MDIVSYILSKKYTDSSVASLKSIGRFLSIWDCGTGLPKTNPTTLPYAYKTGDYYRVGNVVDGSYHHAITLAGTASEHGMHPGTYSVTFDISNSVSTQYTTISAISAVLGENGVSATGVLHTTDESGDITIVKVIEWEDEGALVVALLDDTNQKMGLTLSTADTLTDTVTGGINNYKPNGSTYTGAASTTVETASVEVGWVYYYDGSQWIAQTAAGGGTIWGSITGTLSNQSDLNSALSGKYIKPATGIPSTDISSLPYLTTAPTADNTDGLKIVVLNSEPATKYNGYLYFIKTGS